MVPLQISLKQSISTSQFIDHSKSVQDWIRPADQRLWLTATPWGKRVANFPLVLFLPAPALSGNKAAQTSQPSTARTRLLIKHESWEAERLLHVVAAAFYLLLFTLLLVFLSRHRIRVCPEVAQPLKPARPQTAYGFIKSFLKHFQKVEFIL